jgi:hypothetical protein
MHNHAAPSWDDRSTHSSSPNTFVQEVRQKNSKPLVKAARSLQKEASAVFDIFRTGYHSSAPAPQGDTQLVDIHASGCSFILPLKELLWARARDKGWESSGVIHKGRPESIILVDGSDQLRADVSDGSSHYLIDRSIVCLPAPPQILLSVLEDAVMERLTMKKEKGIFWVT